MKRPKPAWEREPHPQALHVTGSAGDVCLMDCRLWVSLCFLVLVSCSSVKGVLVSALSAAEPYRHRARDDQLPVLPRIQTDDVKVPAGGAAGAPTGTSSGEASVGEFMGPRDPMPRSIFDRLPEVAKPLYSHGLLEE